MSRASKTSGAEGERTPFRLCALAGALAAVAILVGCFVPWLHVDGKEAQRLYEGIQADVDAIDGGVPVTLEDVRLRAEELASDHNLTGLDLYAWFRTTRNARVYFLTQDKGDAPVDDDLQNRVRTLLMVALIALAVAAFLLMVYFAGQRFRRATSPMLILAFVGGLLAIVMAGIYEFLFTPMHEGLQPGVGLYLLLCGGGALLLVALFGVTRKNWWHVYLGSLAVSAGLALFAWTWLGGRVLG